MALFNCFSGKKKKVKDDGNSAPDVKNMNGLRTLQVKVEHPVKSSENAELKSTSFSVTVPFNISEDSRCKVKVHNSESPVRRDDVEVAYEGEDEDDDRSPMKRDDSDFNLQLQASRSSDMEVIDHFALEVNEQCEHESIKGTAAIEEGTDFIQSGHLSDPGRAKVEQWATPKLIRSCSSLDTREVLEKIADRLPLSNSHSFEELQGLAEKAEKVGFLGSPCSQSSAMTHRSADKVMLKKHSSSQILPSRSRKLWWKLFLWSHRNMQNPSNVRTMVSQLASLNQQGGYSSDTVEPGRLKEQRKLESPAGSSSEICSYKSDHNEENNVEKFKGGVSGMWPQNQWVAFSGESSSLKRVNDWVNDLDIQSTTFSVEGEKGYEHIVFPPSPEGNVGASHLSRHSKLNLSEELLHANGLIQSLNSSSTVAHISGMGLKAIPIISHFSSLRSVNLSNNSIVQITAGSLPKGLHVLDLSRNKISIIEGLRELSRLRIVDLSYNRISRIGHGLSNCTLLKELYLAGNKISEVEGLHRLLKLTVLDLSFNKITTTKGLGQLVANYNSLLALNLLGNPIQSNLSDEQLRKAVGGLLTKLAYLNKQPINQQKAREVPVDIVAKISSRGSSRTSYRKSVKASNGGALLSGSVRSNASVAHRSRNKLKSRAHQQTALKTRA